MSIKIALAGNPNCGKTTLFNALTGSNQFVGNWPGVTVEKKEGRLKGNKDVIIMDLPGIYSLSPYTLEEVVARNYLISDRPDVILNIVDGTNIERNLYLTTQLLELGIPVVMAVNMADLLEKAGDNIHIDKLSRRLGCDVVEISALKGYGIMEATDRAVTLAEKGAIEPPIHEFSGEVEDAIRKVREKLGGDVSKLQERFFAVKLLERDDKIAGQLSFVPDVSAEIKILEEAFDDDTESIITNERYTYISSIIKECLEKGRKDKLSISDKIDQVVTNRLLALPIFAAVMFLVYYVSVTTVGTWATDWANDGLLGDGGWNFLGIGGLHIIGLHDAVGRLLEAVGCASWLSGLINDGIVAGVGAVLGFVPQILTLFIFLAFLESCGYMARVAFIMDRIFRKFGLSGKSFIPMLIGSGCGVPGIMASRTIESDRDRKMTIMTTTFVPCSAKLPIIALIAGAFFPKHGGLISTSAYFVGVAAIILSGIILKKTRMFTGEPAPFVMELPPYHMPTAGNVLRSMWERGWSFIKKAGTIILLSTIFVWFTSNFGWADGDFGMLEESQMDSSILAAIGKGIAWIFAPLGWGKWKMAVAAITGLVAKENVVSTFGILFQGTSEVSEDGREVWINLRAYLTAAPAAAAYSFMVFNLLCAPCFAAMGAIKREMNDKKWFFAAIGYQTGLAYAVSLCVYQIGAFVTEGVFGAWTVAAILLMAGFVWLLFRPYKESKKLDINMKSAVGAAK
ncbi:MAG: ferrous iron transport protein B [Lachnospiraceae bacterium]|nr:ferrous iron transport protein B [Lachnospiraceae bacterium]